MCITVKNVYECGHTEEEFTPCAQSRVTPCGKQTVKEINHPGGCSKCDEKG